MQTKLKAKMAIREALYIRQCCDILTGLTLQEEDQVKTFTDKTLERLYIFSMMWSLGAVLELDERAKLQEFVYAHHSKLQLPKIQPEDSMFDYLVGDNGLWVHWSTKVDPFIYPPDEILEFSKILVPNVDNVRTNFLIHLIAKQLKAVLLIGIGLIIRKIIICSLSSFFSR